MKQQLLAGLCSLSLLAGILTTGATPVKSLEPSVQSATQPTVVNYVCTWSRQCSEASGSRNMRDMLCDETLFGDDGWCKTMYSDSRSDLIFLLDDGWDLPDSHGGTVDQEPYFGSHVLDEEKFPGYGDTPQERLKTLADKIAACGWAGTGLWVCANEDAAHQPADGWDETYWRERIEWSRYAGIAYWKIDWGDYCNNHIWRRLISTLAEEIYPELIIEHITGAGGLNDENDTGRVTASYISNNAYGASYADVFRTYDVTTQLTTATTFDRVGEQLLASYVEEGPALGLMNCEDELYMGAALGLSVGVMRYPGSSTKLDEVGRTVNWQKIAPAYAVSDYAVTLSDTYLADDWDFREGDSWVSGLAGRNIKQYAPAAIARGIALPTVSGTTAEQQPFVAASRHPNGAIAIGTYGRTHGRTHTTPCADVTLVVGSLTGPIGIFGTYQSLTLTFDQSVAGNAIYARDLLSDTLVDITDRVTVDGASLILSGELIEEIGRAAASLGDTSEPGLLLQIGEGDAYAAAPANLPRSQVWDIQNGSFETVYPDAQGHTYPVLWSKWNHADASQIAADGHTGTHSAVHTSAQAYEVSTSQTRQGLPNGIYRASVWVQCNGISRADGYANFSAFNGGSDPVSVDIAALANDGALSDWTKLELPEIYVSNGQLQVEVSTKGNAGDVVKFDDMTLEPVALERDALVTALQVNGRAVSDFHSYTTAYDVAIPVTEAGTLPVVTATARGDVAVTITQATALPGTATVTATDGDTTVTYTLRLTATNERYISDMEWVSATTGDGTVGRDKTRDEKTITLVTDDGMRSFEKGVGTHADSEIVIDLTDQGFVRFEAWVGVDTEVDYAYGWGGTVEFEVLADGESVFTSGVMNPRTPAQQVSLDVTGVRTLTLCVTDSGDGKSGDHADWADAKLIYGADAPLRTYLSDLDWESATTGDGEVQRDKNRAEGTITLSMSDGSTRPFSKGLGVHADSVVVYDLTSSGYTRFEAWIGVDYSQDSAYGWGATVEFEILGDGAGLYQSGKMTTRTPAQFVSLDVTGVKKLTLKVTDAGDGKSCDHADWADACLRTVTVEEADAPVFRSSGTVTQSAYRDSATGLMDFSATQADGLPVKYALSQHPAHGRVVLDSSTGVAVYVPNEGYTGSDAFVVRAYIDGLYTGAALKEATVTVRDEENPDSSLVVLGNTAPAFTATAWQQPTIKLTAKQNQPATITYAAVDPDDDALTYVLVASPVHGTATVNTATGAVTYTPAADYVGEDAYTVLASDGRGGIVSLTVPVKVVAQERIRIACVGDSITFGECASSPAVKSYPAQLQALLGDGYYVENFGISGVHLLSSDTMTFSFDLSPYYEQSLAFAPDVVIIMLGTNDVHTMDTQADEYQPALEALIRTYQNLPSTPTVLVNTAPWWNNAALNEILETVVIPGQKAAAEATGCTLIDVHPLFENRSDLLADGLHPNDAGYLLLAQTVVPYVRALYGLLGDVNGDGKVTVSDVRLALRAAVGKTTLTAEQQATADVNGDGRVTVSDVRKILRYAVGKIDTW